MARSRRIGGPYELHPNVHLLTSKDAPEAILQRAGHGQIVETPDGKVYHTHLCSRPLKGLKRSPLGRETAIQECVWGEDGWLRLAHGGVVPALDVPGPFAAPIKPKPARQTYSFSAEAGLPLDFQWLRDSEPRAHFLAEREARMAASPRPRNRSARGSSRRSSPAGRSISPTAPRRSSISARGRFSTRRA